MNNPQGNTRADKDSTSQELPTARILIAGETDEFDIINVPIAFAFDLLEAKERSPSAEELSAIALALYELLPKETPISNWAIMSKIEAISSRL